MHHGEVSRGARAVAGLAVLALIGAAVVGFGLHYWSRPRIFPPADGCAIKALGNTVSLEPEQAANAATISAVAVRRGLPPHAVTVALATALQESKLRNLTYGDRDSLGLFQQRPSQGWGRPEQITDPRFAAGSFYSRLVRIPGWQTMPVAEAAQIVQHSADGSAYASWEPQARTLAQAMTGHAGAGVACTLRHPAGDPRTLARAVLADFGAPVLDGPVVDPVRGWAVAGWLVAHARVHRLAKVSYLGHTWTASTGQWRSAQPVSQRVSFTPAPAQAG